MTSPSHERPAADDSTDGLAMFVTFIAAVLIVTGAVGLLAVLPTWWMLAIALGVHAVGTIIVYVLVLLVFPTSLGAPRPARRQCSGARGGPGHG